MKIAVVGDYDSILGFKAVGLDVCPANGAEEVKVTLKRLMNDGETAIIYITEQAALFAEEEIASCRDRLVPALIPIPGREGSLGIGKQRVKSSIERAVGADIISGTIGEN